MRNGAKAFYKRAIVVGILVSCVVGVNLPASAQKAPKPVPPLRADKDKHLVYTPDEKGNRIPDFSYAGYAAGEKSIPDVSIRILVPAQPGDATARIQSALDYVATLPLDKNGFRGTVLLGPGRFELAGSLFITRSGIVLRGSGMDQNGTVLVGTGVEREAMIAIQGVDNKNIKTAVAITDAYVPVNAQQLTISPGHTIKTGDAVQIHRPSTAAWIKTLGTDHFGGGVTALGWKPGQRDVYWDRQVIAVAGNSLTLDAPLTTALDTAFTRATVSAYTWPGRITQCGIENLRCTSAYATSNPKDENHRWTGITIVNAEDAWIRRITFEHLAGSAVAAFETARRITVEDCKSLAPVSEIGGGRRYTFFTTGQQTLFQRLYSEQGYHDFGVGFCAAGPNAFVQCEAWQPHSFSGALDSWASGILFDVVNIDGQALSFMDRNQDGQGAGWTAANSVFWQCAAGRIDCYAPPTAMNWAFGTWAEFAGNGYWNESNNHIEPRSLYYGQLADRLKADVNERAHLLDNGTEASSNPPPDVAASLTAASVKPALRLTDWIDVTIASAPLNTVTTGLRTITDIRVSKPVSTTTAPAMHITNGWLVSGDAVVTGRRHAVQWWRGTPRPYGLKDAAPHITRFVPGRSGNGYTDRISEVVSWMADENIAALEHNYGLWYERRRDDHERIRRTTGDVWPPFYELPFARSGQGTAWDGLSQYDLTQYNAWYWMRLKQFADLAHHNGRMLVHQQYFQHNILEAGAHWADFPWRAANNINTTGFPEPPPYAGDKRIFMAEQFYDVTHPARRALHRAYIRKCLDAFADNSNVIHCISAEYSGPQHFVAFWLDTILEWEKETGKNAMVALSAPKDVQDAILQDSARAAAVDIIDIRYWHYRNDGSAYAPAGGQNLAPRQHARTGKPGKSSFEHVYRAVREYREKYQGKVVTYSSDGYEGQAWAALLGGGSLAAIPPVQHAGFATAVTGMKPLDLPGSPEGLWLLGSPGKAYVLYMNGTEATVTLPDAGTSATVRWIDPQNGRVVREDRNVKTGKAVDLKSPATGPMAAWIVVK